MRSCIFLSCFIILFESCSIFPTNTIREKRNRCFLFDIKNISIVRKCSSIDYGVIKILIIEKDSISKKNIASTPIDNIEGIQKKAAFQVKEYINDSMRRHVISIMLQTDRHKTYYWVDILPSDWKSKQEVKHFRKVEW